MIISILRNVQVAVFNLIVFVSAVLYRACIIPRGFKLPFHSSLYKPQLF